MKISSISPENRPIERLNKLGFSALSDAEILAIILRTGTKSENVINQSIVLFFPTILINSTTIFLKTSRTLKP